MTTTRPKIAIFHYSVTKGNPAGSCHMPVLKELCETVDFTVFANAFENPRPGRITWVKVWVPTRPLVLLFIAFHIVAPICYLIYRLTRHVRFDLVQLVESNLLFGDLSYSHFCHRAYLERQNRDRREHSLRVYLRQMDHRFHAALEPAVYKRVKRIVSPSQGLKRELSLSYPYASHKITVIPNPVDLDRMRCPTTFDRAKFSAALGYVSTDLVLVFVALGHFERKGLPLLLSSIATLKDRRLKLIVVGGRTHLVCEYQRHCKSLGLLDEVTFVGLQADVRPYLWCADAFILPSEYEVFPLVALEAAAAGLPILATSLNGIEEFLQDETNGFLLEHRVEQMVSVFSRLLSSDREDLRRMGEHARRDVAGYGLGNFVNRWRNFYCEVGATG